MATESEKSLKGQAVDLTERIATLSDAKRSLLELKLRKKNALDRPEIPRRGGGDSIPPSFAQQRLWFLDQLTPGGATYNMPTAVRIRGPLDVETLNKSLSEIIRRHEALRTCIITVEGQPIQKIKPAVSYFVDLIDVSGLPEAERITEVDHLVDEEVGRPFDLSKDLLFRAKLVRLGEEEYVFVFTMHHVASDAWSMRVFARELAELYEAFSEGRQPNLPELPIQYADYALWQRQSLENQILENQLSYWRHHLSGSLTLDLPTDYPRPAVETYTGQMVTRDLGLDLSNELVLLSHRQAVTLYMTLLAAFQTLLHRYTGQTDVVVGSPVANRDRVELEALIGLFVNTLVIRTDFSDDPSFLELLRRVKDVALRAFANKDLPFERLVTELNTERDLSRNPIFQVMFALENSPVVDANFSTLSVTPYGRKITTTRFDLEVFFWKRSDVLNVSVRYNTALFKHATVERMLGHLLVLLRGITANPGQRISALPLLTEGENRQLAQWNKTRRDYPKDLTIHQVFEAIAVRYPDRIAIVSGEERLTYGQLNERANRLAHYLRKLGVDAEVLVGLCVDRSPQMVVALLGILKAGGAYLPLDPRYPRERLKFMLEDARVSVLLTEECFRKQFAGNDLRFVYLDSNAAAVAKDHSESPISSSGPDSLAYVMYTSGSTGRPKGVEVRHRSVLRLLFGVDYVELNEDKAILQMAPISFDASTFELWGALLHGGRSVLFPDRVPTISTLGSALRTHSITTLWLTSSLYNMVIEEAPEVLTGVRQLLIGGEALSVKHVRRGLSLLPFTQIINGYGPTESTTFACCYPIPRTFDDSFRSVPIGMPISNTEVYVLDRNLQPVPVGVAGELLIGGAGRARGYLNRPELTREKFVPHPFSAEPGARLYKTGDLVRYLADGNIEFIGRIDGQVKLRGFRVELEEIEAVLREHPAVGEAAVLACETTPVDKRLIAYIVPASEFVPTAPELQAFLRTKLPDYMVPALFVNMESFPLTPSGKTDRRALPAPSDGREGVTELIAPTNDVERQLVQIWEEELGVRPISIRDNFFDLGGHSLLAVRVFARIEKSLGVRLPLAELFHAATVEGLAKVIGGSNGSSSWRSLVSIQTGNGRPPFFAVPGVGGDVICYADLARLLAPEQPFYGLQSRGLDGSEEPFARMEDIAAAFIKEICEVQPSGPYYLMGLCMGGVVAYEMAQQLRAAGQEVALLLLLETWMPKASRRRWLRPHIRWLATMKFVVGRFRLYLQTLKRFRGRQWLDYLLERVKMPLQMVKQRDAFRGDSRDFYLQVVMEANLVALQNYKPRPYPGRVVLFRAQGRQVTGEKDRRLAWRQLTLGGLEVYDVPGDDSGLTLKEPHVRVLARQIEACIKRAQHIAIFVASTIEATRLIVAMAGGI
jgi:amino acid adenylation domain-containing protein